MISSKAGATFPVALTDASIVPRSAVDNVMSLDDTDGRIIVTAIAIAAIQPPAISEILIMFRRLALRRSSIGISLSIAQFVYVNNRHTSCQTSKVLIYSVLGKRASVRFRTICTVWDVQKERIRLEIFKSDSF